MIYKLLIAGVGLAVSYVVAKKLADAQASSRVKVRDREQPLKGRRLRQDPKTGIYHPED
jgi:hypothetical protein